MLDPDGWGAALRVWLTYSWCHRRLPRLADPARFTELVQWRKLTLRDPDVPGWIDKVEAKDRVAARLGREWVVPLLWHGRELPERRPSTQPIVVKPRHGCNRIAFVADADDWHNARSVMQREADRPYCEWLDEWGYRQVPRGLLVEPHLGDPATLPLDYKLFVFGGRVEFVQVHLNRRRRHRWIVFDRNWRRVSAPGADADDPPPPVSLAQMIAGAEELARGFDFVRVDLYEDTGHPKFGELTFYPGSGLMPFDPDGLDFEMGRLWLRARRTAVAVPRHASLEPTPALPT